MKMAFLVLGLGLSAAAPLSASPDVPPVPTNLEVPAGHVLFLGTRAAGTQNYVCMPAGRQQVAWRFIGPQATLFVDGTGGAPPQVTTHFLSANPAEGGAARPAWQHSIDTSRVWGRVRSSSADASYVAPGAIPWLLLETAGTAVGPAGGSFMAQTTFIQRVNTAGGIAPAAGCANDDDLGRIALVPYTTDYFFYRANQD